MSESRTKRKNGKVVKMSESKKEKIVDLGAENVKEADPSKYGYRENDTIEVNANKYIMYLRQLLTAVAMDAREERVTIKDDIKSSMESLQYMTTPLGLKVAEFAESIYEDHVENVRKGKCTPISILQKEISEKMEAQKNNTEVENADK